MGRKKGLSFSLKRATGISGLKNKIARSIGIPTTKQGLYTKVGKSAVSLIIGKKKKRK